MPLGTVKLVMRVWPRAGIRDVMTSRIKSRVRLGKFDTVSGVAPGILSTWTA